MTSSGEKRLSHRSTVPLRPVPRYGRAVDPHQRHRPRSTSPAATGVVDREVRLAARREQLARAPVQHPLERPVRGGGARPAAGPRTDGGTGTAHPPCRAARRTGSSAPAPRGPPTSRCARAAASQPAPSRYSSTDVRVRNSTTSSGRPVDQLVAEELGHQPVVAGETSAASARRRGGPAPRARRGRCPAAQPSVRSTSDAAAVVVERSRPASRSAAAPSAGLSARSSARISISVRRARSRAAGQRRVLARRQRELGALGQVRHQDAERAEAVRIRRRWTSSSASTNGRGPLEQRATESRQQHGRPVRARRGERRQGLGSGAGRPRRAPGRGTRRGRSGRCRLR